MFDIVCFYEFESVLALGTAPAFGYRFYTVQKYNVYNLYIELL